MSHRCLLPLACVLVACAAPPPPPPPPRSEADVLVDRVVAAYGGPAAVTRLAASRIDGVVESHVRDMGGPGSVRRDFLAPDKLRVEIAYPGSTELRILDGERGWRGDEAGTAAVAGPPLLAMQFQLLRLQPAWVLDHHRERVTALAPTGGADGRRTLRLTWSPALMLDYVLDADARVIHVEALLKTGPMTLQFATDYADFRQVDGAWLPFAEENFASGRHTASTRVKAVSLGAVDLGPFVP